MKAFKRGDIVRYNGGSTALVMLSQRHAGGWHADHCMGGLTYVNDNGNLRHADAEDLRMWQKCAWHRGIGIPPTWRPKIVKTDGHYVVRFKNDVPQRWLKQFNAMLEQATGFVRRINAKESQHEA